jgi:hypothetical protein
MGMDYPDHLLAREAAPPFDGEGPFALWHFSEDPSLDRFLPRASAASREAPLVWAVDSRHGPMFWFPRDCPRGCIWPVASTTAADRERFFGQSAAARIHVMEAGWLKRPLVRVPTSTQPPHRHHAHSAGRISGSSWGVQVAGCPHVHTLATAVGKRGP